LFPWSQDLAEPINLAVDLAILDMAAGIEIDVMPVLVTGGVAQAGQGRRRRVAGFIVKARVVADVVRPGGRLGQNIGAIRRSGPLHPSPVVRVVGQGLADGLAGRRRHLLPGNDGNQAMTGGVPGQGRGGQAKEKQAEKELTHEAIMPRAIIASYVQIAHPFALQLPRLRPA
jgi:hypothetical protein